MLHFPIDTAPQHRWKRNPALLIVVCRYEKHRKNYRYNHIIGLHHCPSWKRTFTSTKHPRHVELLQRWRFSFLCRWSLVWVITWAVAMRPCLHIIPWNNKNRLNIKKQNSISQEMKAFKGMSHSNWEVLQLEENAYKINCKNFVSTLNVLFVIEALFTLVL